LRAAARKSRESKDSTRGRSMASGQFQSKSTMGFDGSGKSAASRSGKSAVSRKGGEG